MEESAQACRKRMWERTYYAVLATGLAVVFMLATAKVPSLDDAVKGLATGIVLYTLGDKQGAKRERKRNTPTEIEEEEESES